MSDVNTPAIVMKRSDYAELVSADIEYRVRGNVIRCAKRVLECVKISKIGSLQQTDPS